MSRPLPCKPHRNGYQADRSQHHIQVHPEKTAQTVTLHYLAPLRTLKPVTTKQPQTCEKAEPLGNQRADGHPGNLPSEAIHQQQADSDVRQVYHNGCDHEHTRILHTEKPPRKCVSAKHRRCAVNQYREIIRSKGTRHRVWIDKRPQQPQYRPLQKHHPHPGT